MLCGGCAAKVGQSVLQRALERVGPDHGDGDVVLGLDSADDAAAVRMPGGQLLATSVDMFSAFTDDAWSVGGAAAVNAASDLLATGVRPRYAMALVAVPESSDSEEAEEILFQALSGARAAFGALGVRLLGGHTHDGSSIDGGLLGRWLCGIGGCALSARCTEGGTGVAPDQALGHRGDLP